jgi:hypothetical protein
LATGARTETNHKLYNRFSIETFLIVKNKNASTTIIVCGGVFLDYIGKNVNFHKNYPSTTAISSAVKPYKSYTKTSISRSKSCVSAAFKARIFSTKAMRVLILKIL